MGLYDTFKLTNSRPMSTYVAAPIEDFKETAAALTAKYDKSFGQTINNISSVSSAQAANFENDQSMLSELQNKYGSMFQEQVKQGDFENMGQLAMLAGVKFQKEYAPIKGNLDKVTAYKADLDKQLADKTIDKGSYTGAMNVSMRNYKGLDPNNIAGSGFVGYKPAAYVDIQDMMFKRAAGWKADSKDSPFQYDGNGWWNKHTGKEVKESEVATALKQSLMADPMATAYMRDQILFNTPEVVTEEDVAGIRASYTNLYKKDPVSVEIVKSMSPKELYARNYQDNLIENAVRPAAAKESFREDKLTQQRDTVYDWDRKEQLKADRIESQVRDGLRTKFGEYKNNAAFTDMQEKFSGLDNLFDSKGNLPDPGKTNMAYGDKSRIYNAKEQVSLYRASYLNNLVKEREQFRGKSTPRFNEVTAKITVVQKMSDKDLMGKIMGSIEKRQAALVTDITLPSELSTKIQKEIVDARDYDGRGLIVDGMEGVTSMNQLLTQLELTDGDSKTAARVAKFYDSIKISGINLTGGDGAGSSAATGGYRFTAIDPVTGNTIHGLLENNVETKQLFNTISKVNMFALTNTDIGFPIDYAHKGKYSKEQQEAKYADHVIPDLYNETGHRMIAYNTIDEEGVLVPMTMRQKITDDGTWMNTPLPDQVAAVYKGTIKDNKVGLLNYKDFENYTKQLVTKFEVNARLRKPSEDYNDTPLALPVVQPAE